MSGIASPSLSNNQIDQVLKAVQGRLHLSITSTTHLQPGQLLTATVLPSVPEIDASELVNGILNLAWLGKDVLFNDVAPVPIPTTDTIADGSALNGDKLLTALQATPGNVVKQPFPLPTLGAATVPQTAGVASQLFGTFALPKLTVGIRFRWRIKNSTGQDLAEGKNFISLQGISNPTASFLLPPLFRELRTDTLAFPGGSVFCLSVDVDLLLAGRTLSFTLGPIPVLQLPLLIPTVVALFSEPNFSITADSSVLIVVPKHSPFAAAEPLFKELRRIEKVVDTLSSIGSIATFILGLDGLLEAVPGQPRIRFIADNGVPKFKNIVLKRRPWYDVFRNDETFDDRANSIIVFGLPGTRVTFYNDNHYDNEDNQGYYEVKLNDTVTPNNPFPDLFVFIRNLFSSEITEGNWSPDNKVDFPETFPPGRIVTQNSSLDQTNDHSWDTDLSSMKFHDDWLDGPTVKTEIENPTKSIRLACWKVPFPGDLETGERSQR